MNCPICNEELKRIFPNKWARILDAPKEWKCVSCGIIFKQNIGSNYLDPNTGKEVYKINDDSSFTKIIIKQRKLRNLIKRLWITLFGIKIGPLKGYRIIPRKVKFHDLKNSPMSALSNNIYFMNTIKYKEDL